MVPCGRCPECRARRVSAWSFRLMQEERHSSSAFFVTLTYDTDHVPISRAGYMTCNKKDCQNFFKRLRKSYGTCCPVIKYYLAAEYGSKGMRPHYHIILFGADVDNILSAWTHGHCFIGTVTGASVGYTLKYISKPRKIPLHRNDDREPEFSLMSKGLGAAYLDTYRSFHMADVVNRAYCTTKQGNKISMPRYYRDRLYSSEQREAISCRNMERLADVMLERYNVSVDVGQAFRDREQQIERAYAKMNVDIPKGKL